MNTQLRKEVVEVVDPWLVVFDHEPVAVVIERYDGKQKDQEETTKSYQFNGRHMPGVLCLYNDTIYSKHKI